MHCVDDLTIINGFSNDTHDALYQDLLDIIDENGEMDQQFADLANELHDRMLKLINDVRSSMHDKTRKITQLL